MYLRCIGGIQPLHHSANGPPPLAQGRQKDFAEADGAGELITNCII